MPHIINDADQRRFELEISSGLAIADYRVSGDKLTIFHTDVPVALRRRGIGCRLVKGAPEEIRKLGLKVVPQCWFVREYLDRNPEFADLLH